MWGTMLPFQPKHRLADPENNLFSLSQKIFSGSKYPKNLLFNFEKGNAGGGGSGSAVYDAKNLRSRVHISFHRSVCLESSCQDLGQCCRRCEPWQGCEHEGTHRSTASLVKQYGWPCKRVKLVGVVSHHVVTGLVSCLRGQ